MPKVWKVDGVDGSNTFANAKIRALYSADAATNNIAKGDWVRIDVGNSQDGLGYSVEQIPGNVTAGDPYCFGVATHALSAAGYVKVQYAGRYGDSGTAGEGAATDGGVAAGNALVAGDGGGGSTAGQIDTYAAGTHTAAGPIGLALTANGAGSYGANEATVMITDQGWF